jgi:hypothetical protein
MVPWPCVATAHSYRAAVRAVHAATAAPLRHNQPTRRNLGRESHHLTPVSIAQ